MAALIVKRAWNGPEFENCWMGIPVKSITKRTKNMKQEIRWFKKMT